MNPPDGPDNFTASEKSLRDYTDVVLRRVWTIIVVIFLTVLLAAIYAWTCTPYYTSTATVELEDRNSKNKDREGVIGRPDYDQFKGYLATQLEILMSRGLVEDLVVRMNLLERPEFASPEWFSTLLLWLGLNVEYQAVSPEEAKKNSVVSKVIARVTVKPMRQSNLIQVSMNATDPVLAAKMLQNYIDLYLERNLDKRRKDSYQSALWLKGELERVDNKLREAQVSLLDFILDHGIVDSKDGALAQVLKLVNKTMEGHVKSQEARARIQAMDQQDVQEEAALLLPKEINNEYLGKLKQDLAMMESEYTQMRGLYALNYPKLIMLDKKIKFLRERVATIEKNLVSSALDMAKREETLLKGSFDKAKKEASRVRSLEAQYASLKKDVDTGSEFQKILLKEYKQMDIRARTTSNDMRVVDLPSVPTFPSWPKKPLLLLIACVLGIIAGVTCAFVVDQFDDTLQSPREIDTNFKVKRLGAVPHIQKLAMGMDLGKNVMTRPYEFLAYDYPKTLISDAIKNIQASIFLSNPGSPVQCMLVTSSAPTEGKTLVAASIATVLTADRTKRVVIADADLRRPRIHKLFGNGDTKLGLSSFLSDTSLAVSDLVHPHRIPGLFYIPAGSALEDPFLLLQSERMGRAIEELRELFDYIIIDSPPILRLPDVPIICNKTDGVVLVARQGHVGRHELKEAMDTLAQVSGCRLLGVVMNMAYAPGFSGYSSRYGSHYYGNYHKYYSRPA